MTWSPELCRQNKQGSSVKGWGICAHCHGNHTERGGGGEPGARLPFTDVRPPEPQTWGRLWVAWRPLEANEGWLDRRPFHLVSPWVGVGGKTLAQSLGRAPCTLLAQESRGALSVRTRQKYQAEIRAAAPTHRAKNSPVLGGVGIPHRKLARCPCCPCAMGGPLRDEPISWAGQPRPRTGQGHSQAVSEKALSSARAGSKPGTAWRMKSSFSFFQNGWG